MKIICNGVLDVCEIEHLKALANINCEGIICFRCPLNVKDKDGNMQYCVKDIADLCLKDNNINTERSEHEQENN